MSWGNRRTVAMGAAALGVVALLMAACGGGSGPRADANSATTTSSSSTSTPAPSSTTSSSANATSPTTTGSSTSTSARSSATSAGTPTSKAPTTTAPSTTTTAKPTTTTAAATNVTASEREYKITLSQTTFHPGSYVFKAVNTGTTTHAFVISGPGVNASTNDIDPGGSDTVKVTLQAGTYEIHCPVDGHKSLGMDVHITVS